MQKIIVHSSLLWLAFIAFTLTTRAQKTGRTDNSFQSRGNMGSFMQISEDSSYNPVRTFVIYRNESLYNITMAEGKVLELSIDGRKLPADSFHVYDPLIKRISEQIKRDREQALRDKEQAVRDQEQAVRDLEQASKDRGQAQRDKEQAERDVMQAQRNQEEALKDQQQALRNQAQAMRDQAQAGRDRTQAERDEQQAMRDQAQAKRDARQAEEDAAMFKGLISEVIKDGLAPDEKSVVSMHLDDFEFILNGKKQSDAIHKKYKDKYLKTPDSSYSYRR